MLLSLLYISFITLQMTAHMTNQRAFSRKETKVDNKLSEQNI